MKRVLGCLVVSLAVAVNAQEFTSAPAKLARDNYLNTLSKADSTYTTALESALRQAESKKDNDEADRIKAALAELVDNQSLDAMAPDQVARLTWKSATVQAGESCEIGKVGKGDKLLVKYVKGMISFWNKPLQNPNETDKVRVALQGKAGATVGPLAAIPTNTKEKPFEYTFDNAFESILLRASDAQGNAKRPAGAVIFKYVIIRAK